MMEMAVEAFEQEAVVIVARDVRVYPQYPQQSISAKASVVVEPYGTCRDPSPQVLICL